LFRDIMKEVYSLPGIEGCALAESDARVRWGKAELTGSAHRVRPEVRLGGWW
jgi:hypothetical protein